MFINNEPSETVTLSPKEIQTNQSIALYSYPGFMETVSVPFRRHGFTDFHGYIMARVFMFLDAACVTVKVKNLRYIVAVE